VIIRWRLAADRVQATLRGIDGGTPRVDRAKESADMTVSVLPAHSASNCPNAAGRMLRYIVHETVSSRARPVKASRAIRCDSITWRSW